MRSTSLLVFVLGMSACGGKDANDTDNVNDTDKNPTATYEFVGSAAVATTVAELPKAVVDAQRAVTSVLAATTLAAAEPEVQNSLGASVAPDNFCWSIDDPGLTSYTIDYGQCDDMFTTTGAIRVKQILGGYTGLSFLPLDLNERPIAGALGFQGDGEPVEGEPLRFTVYDTVGDNPQPTNRSPIGVEVGGSPIGVLWDGGLELDTASRQLRAWGLASVYAFDGTETIVRVGGSDDATLVGAVPPADAMVASLSYVDCRCPSGGTIEFDADVVLSEVTIDLDDLLTEDDGFDDPVLEIGVDHVVSGSVLLTSTDCGENDLTYTPDAAEIAIPVDGQAFALEIEKKCDALLIDDEAKCEALIFAAQSADAITLTVPAPVLQTAVVVDGLTQFDGTYCQF